MKLNQEFNDLGLKLILDFINEQEEQEILQNIPKTLKKNTITRNSIYRYGAIAYKSDVVSSDIPKYFHKILDKFQERPNSLTINEYYPGQEILPHIDNKESGEVISTLSLLSEANIRFSCKLEYFSVLLPPRSLLQMKGTARHFWKHSVNSIKSHRYSIVFRHVKCS